MNLLQTEGYHLAMASLYVWDACENGKRATKWKAAGGIQWTWDKKTKQWTGPDPVKKQES
jgi:predicted RNA-binding protein associated with RNAse of E/G family